MRNENNTIINHSGVINFNCSVSGYFRNNKIIKHQAQSVSNQLVMKGIVLLLVMVMLVCILTS
jgi:hypothetical protein